MGKRTRLDEFAGQKRGGIGLRCYKVTEKTGCLIGAVLTNEDRDVLLMTNEGVIIRLSVNDISVIGRNTSGVRLMNIDRNSNVRVAGFTKMLVSRNDEDENESENESVSEDEEEE